MYNNAIDLIEKVQRKALKYMFFKCNGYYPERGFSHNTLLSSSSVDPLCIRRNTFALSFLFKLLHNEIDCSHLLNQINFNIPRLGGRQHPIFYCSACHTNVMKKSPVYTMCTLFNSICDACDINCDTRETIISTYLSRFSATR